MARNTKALLSAAVLGATCVLNVEAATDAERIAALEAQLNQQKAAMQQQQRMTESMDAGLQRLKTGEPAAVIPAGQVTGAEPNPLAPSEQVFGSDPDATTVAGASAPAPEPASKLSAKVYGFVMADAIYDFKRVDPDWQDTLRVTTIPTQSGQFGSDGNFVFSVRQSRLGIQGDYGEDITYKLAGELFGVGSDQGQTTLRVRHAWATYKEFGMGQTWI